MSCPIRSRRLLIWSSLAVALLLGGCLDLSDPFRYTPPVATDASGDFPAGPPRQFNGDVVRVATFNLALFFDPVCDTGQCGPDDFEAAPSLDEFAARADAHAAAIRALEADIVLLQEVESRESLDALMVRLADRYRVGVIGEQGSPGSIDVAVLANGRLIEERHHGNEPLALPGGGTGHFEREFLEVHFALTDVAIDERRAEVIVFVAHFKSKFNDEPDLRLAEARAAHDIVLDVADDNDRLMVLFGGDLNDTPGSEPLNALLSDGKLIRAGAELPEDQMDTFGSQAIDHLFIAATAGGEYRTGSAQVFRVGNDGWGDSDHGALVADFEIDFEELRNR